MDRHFSPQGNQAVFPIPGGVSSDHRYAFVAVAPIDGGNHPAGSFATEGYAAYLGNPDGTFELIGLGSLGSERLAQGRYISEGGEHVIFTTGSNLAESNWCSREASKCPVLKLEPNAPETGTGAVYDRQADGPTHVVSLLPEDKTPAPGEEAFYQGASKDGSVIAFKIKGVLYARVDNSETVEATSEESTYAGLSDDGAYLFYVAAGNIHRFDTTTEQDDQVNSSGDAEVVNVSADGSHVYFISKSQLDGTKGTAGQPNMYVWSGGEPEYVETVAPSDLVKTSGTHAGYPALTTWIEWVVTPNRVKNADGVGPGASSTRTTPDGSVLVFESRAQLTSYDNDGHTEIYRYDDASGSLICVSCNPLAEPATKDARLQELSLVRPAIVLHNLSDDGSRVFFETKEALVERDTDGVNDIYQWHEEGTGASIDLISSGKSKEYPPLLTVPNLPSPNILLSITPSGNDVFFLAQEALVPGAGTGGTAAIYDARVNGGFPVPPTPAICLEEGCRPVPQPIPSFLLPASETTVGAGNVKPRKKKRCRRHSRAGKTNKQRRCAKKRKAKGSMARVSAAVGADGSEGSQAAQALPASVPATAAGAAVDEEQARAASPTTLAPGEFDDFGIESVGADESTTVAGMHPDFITRFSLHHEINSKTGLPESDARTQEVTVSLPPGLLGNPNAIPRCETGQLVAFANCPIDSQVGVATLLIGGFGEATEPIYNLQPPHPDEEVARLGFYGGLYPVFIDIKVRTASDYGVTATVHSAPGQAPLLEGETTLWGNPADPSHDPYRLTAVEAPNCNATGTACEAPGGKRESTIPLAERKPFMTNPSACQPMSVGFAVTSYQLPGQVFTATAPMDPITDCTGLPFNPSFSATPTNPTAGAPTGLRTTLTIPQTQDPDAKATSTMREARVTLPEGMTIAAGAADGLQACTDAQVGYHEEVNAACPDASKLGTATITSPSLPQPLQASLYQRTPEPGRLFGLWLATDSLGLHVKLPGEIKPDPNTGQLTATFSELPQVPVSEIALNVWGGPRAPLKNPDACGTYATAYAFTPHSADPPVSGASQMTIDQGCNTGGFTPTLHAGATEPVAGAFSPFVLDIARGDGEQNLGSLQITLPPGELAKLAGVPLCPEAAAPTGACPPASRIGHLTVAAGPGPQPLWLPQSGKAPTAVYLAGPYKSAPFSVVAVVPAQAGPFDLGVVSVRSALDVDPVTAQAVVKSDPLPQFIEGVAAVYRRLHVVVDRPGFSLNPTDCSELQTTSTIASTQGTLAHPASRFQVDGCRALGFKPKLSLKLKGGTKRGDYPALTATLKARKGDANVGRVAVALPHSAFLAQEHIATICTRKRYAAGTCPKGSVYGTAKAWTPLLDKPLEGPVYLRSSDNPLPDMVVALGGEIDVELSGRIDSHNEGIRTTFAAVPDAPITRFVLRMKGGAKGLLVNSENLCARTNRAAVAMRGQNGRRAGLRPVVGVMGCGGKKGKR
jgi:hypothetical protein